MPQTGVAVNLANYHVTLCVHVVEIVGNAAMTRPRLTRNGKMMMTTQLILMNKNSANELSLIFTWTLFVKLNFSVF